LIFSANLSKIFLILRRTERDMIKMYGAFHNFLRDYNYL
jgi:hypothetical protein